MTVEELQAHLEHYHPKAKVLLCESKKGTTVNRYELEDVQLPPDMTDEWVDLVFEMR